VSSVTRERTDSPAPCRLGTYTLRLSMGHERVTAATCPRALKARGPRVERGRARARGRRRGRRRRRQRRALRARVEGEGGAFFMSAGTARGDGERPRVVASLPAYSRPQSLGKSEARPIEYEGPNV